MVILAKVFQRPHDLRVFIVRWDKENNTAEEYYISDPSKRWKVEVALDGDRLFIVAPQGYEINARRQEAGDGVVWFKGVEVNSFEMKGEQVNIFVLADSRHSDSKDIQDIAMMTTKYQQ
ncbi:MAG: hypothetical protein FWD01_03950 [Defluviitaleaceae bacterium]|nr:hypothetical protein [Defluviitaleaceae bacterium]